MTKKVYVGMSGGVDSSVAAALLVKSGYDVTGVFMKNWAQDLPGLPCTWRQDYEDAKRVAVDLGIDFKLYDFQDQYKQKVVDYLVAEYQAGHTPNPDIMCNQEIKFKLFYELAMSEGANCIATGHYARSDLGLNAEAQLIAASDANKDQTYFLYRISQGALANTIFPLGELTKPEVRSIASQMKLTTAEKPDSQGICFVGRVGIKDFLMNYVPINKGKIIDQSGKIIGQHEGAIFYTIGQRHGLDVGGGFPYYVSGKDMSKNYIYVTTNLNDSSLWVKDIELTNMHWINKPALSGKVYDIRTRHRAQLVKAEVAGSRDRYKVILEDEIRTVAPGQSVVIYDDGVVTGGGIVV